MWKHLAAQAGTIHAQLIRIAICIKYPGQDAALQFLLVVIAAVCRSFDLLQINKHCRCAYIIL
jgi:hypothetical protein